MRLAEHALLRNINNQHATEFQTACVLHVLRARPLNIKQGLVAVFWTGSVVLAERAVQGKGRLGLAIALLAQIQRARHALSGSTRMGQECVWRAAMLVLGSTTQLLG